MSDCGGVPEQAWPTSTWPGGSEPLRPAALAARLPLRLQVTTLPFAQLDKALLEVAEERVGGSVVVTNG